MKTTERLYHNLINGIKVVFILVCLLSIAVPLQAQSPEGNHIYLPIIFGSLETSPEEQGTAQIKAAGRLPSENVSPENKAISEVIKEPQIRGTDPIKTIQCSTQKWTSTEVRELQDRIILNANDGIIYPGALLQGKDLENGIFSPITIPRSGGTIRVEGLKLTPHARYSAELNEISGASVKQAIEDILSTEIKGTAARASYVLDQTFSFDHLLFSLGINARSGATSMQAELAIDTEKKRNFVFMKFSQVYYDVIFEDPELSTSVFRDGDSFTDPENQIAPGNPPLYVQKVSYGRSVYFIAESEYDAKDVKATMEAAYNGLIADATVRSGLTHRDVMAKTKVHYFVIGGNAGLALAPIDSADETAMFDKVKGFLGDKNAANFSASNPGVPIAYTLRYLHDRSVARMSYSVTYGKRDCKAVLRAAANVTVRFTKVKILDDAENFGAGNIRFDFKVYGGASDPTIEHFPSKGTKDMDSGKTYPFDQSIELELSETDELRIEVNGTEYDSGANGSNDPMGTGSNIWKLDTWWGTRPLNTHVIHGKDDGEYEMYYEIKVDWIRPPSTPSPKEFKMISVDTSECLDIDIGGGRPLANGQLAQGWPCLGDNQTNQVFTLKSVGKHYQLIVNHSGKCLDVDISASPNADGRNIQQWDCLGNSQANQLWNAVPYRDGSYRFYAIHSNKCMGLSRKRNNPANGAYLVHQWTCNNGAEQRWQLRLIK